MPGPSPKPPLVAIGSLRCAPFCLGTSEFGVRPQKDAAFDLLDALVELGGNFIDTARIYCDWHPGEDGRSEKIIGDWASKHGVRKDIILATKGGHPPLDDLHHPRLRPEDLATDLTASLDSLRSDFIDLYWLHRDDESIPVGELIGVLNEFVASGRVREFGCSNWSAARIEEAQAWASGHGMRGFAANQPLWSLAAHWMQGTGVPGIAPFDRAAYRYHQSTGLPALPFSPQAGGFFDKYLASGGRLHDARVQTYLTPGNLALAVEVEEIAQKHNISPCALCLAWLKSQPFPVVPIVGCRNRGQLENSVAAWTVVLSSEDIAHLNREAGYPEP